MKVQCLPSDIIGRLPDNIIEMILTLMPIRDAVRTSILSTKWRYNWVKIPKLVFHSWQFQGLTVNNEGSENCKIFNAIFQVLLLHKGPIVEFSLNCSCSGVGNDVDQIIYLLLRKNTLKKFTFIARCNKLPSSFYSLQQLTHLNLAYCELESPSTFNGFNMLTSLSLEFVLITEKVLLHLISGCPRLKHFTFVASFDFAFGEECSIVELFKFLNVIEHLELNLYLIRFFFTGGVPRKLPTPLVHIKCLDIHVTLMMGPDLFIFTLLLIRSSPNLEKIKIKMDEEDVCIEEYDNLVESQDYEVRLDHLTEFEIMYYRNSTVALELLKLILVKSPMLKKVHLKACDVESKKKATKMMRSFLHLPRASPVVDIIVQRLGTW